MEGYKDRTETARIVPLNRLPAGCRAWVMAVYGGRRFTQRLADMGIWPGAEVLLIKGGLVGPVMVEVCGVRYVLGHGMAERITVQPR